MMRRRGAGRIGEEQETKIEGGGEDGKEEDERMLKKELERRVEREKIEGSEGRRRG